MALRQLVPRLGMSLRSTAAAGSYPTRTRNTLQCVRQLSFTPQHSSWKRFFSTPEQTSAESKKSETPNEEEVSADAAAAAAETVENADAAEDVAEDPKVVELNTILNEKEEKISDQAAKLEELLDKYTRALADSENVRTRARLEVEQAKEFAIQKFAKDLVGIVDILELATDAVPEEELEKDKNPHLAALYTGLESIHKLLLQTFNGHGMNQIDPLGQPFDPNLHDAQFEMDATDEFGPGTVGVVTKKGYILKNRTVRPACVGVVRSDS